MIVYFDKANYIKYLKTVDDDKEGPDTLRMLKNQLSIHLNFKTEDLDEYEQVLLEEFQSGVSTHFKFTFGDNEIVRPIKKENLPSKNGIYLLDDSSLSSLKKQHTVVAGGVGEEIDALKTLIIDIDYSFHAERVIGKDITYTNHLNILGLPFSTLVVVDRYMFKGPEVGGNLGLYQYNLDLILKNAFINKQGYSRLIFVYQINTKVANTSPYYDEGPDLEKLTTKIKKVTHKYCPAPELYFIGVPSGIIDDEHDRFIISNYLRIKSGDSLIYFDSSGVVTTKSKTVDFYSLGNKNYRDVNTIILNKLSQIIEETLDKHPKYSKVPHGTQSKEVINFN
ncbi:hypothetical protein EOD41_01080 [Mucilaginibacter limnophilus]|uniref:Uncharacterized protein n=1 Tax=Mucilaginibacter limnophilus TaxID=1932778 RepID=A0A437MY50_9SPHI|nr:hypothetical protein [Mucilaginibacter limnophilus]RVU02563.1 hypothetical protein EOD41_01080 [Mucilaginibacter limnophilus]